MQLYRIAIASGEMTRITGLSGNYEGAEFTQDCRRYAAIHRSWDGLGELVLGEAGNQTKLTDSHDSAGFMKNIKLKPKLFSYQNRLGQTVHGFMFLPPGWKKSDKRPLMIYVYGGPLGISKSVTDGDFNSTAYLFNMYLSHVLGYVTVTIDPRGQSGYGSVFGKANWERPGVPQVEDLSDGVKHLVANYGVDSKRVAINGWSFGGFQTQMCLYTAPDVFTLGIAGAGPTEWQNYNTWYVGGVIGNAPKGKPEPIDKYSLTHLAKNLKSPMMLLHGVEDTNVLFQDTIAVYRELLQAGKGHLVELAIDPTGGHGMGGDMSNRDRHAIYLSFLLKHWGVPVKRRR
jgi:dipeptidyl aminopeptidase/acylaminoacyl peptidase